MTFDETPVTVLGAAVRALEADGKEVTEKSLLEATEKQGIDRSQVKDFMEKAERGKKRRRYPGYTPKNTL